MAPTDRRIYVSPFTNGDGISAPHVLLVEDDDELRDSLAENLRLNGVTVSEADCGSACHEAMRQQVFDVAILDVNLPDANGFDLAASFTGNHRRPGIIMLTARAGQADRIRGYSEGADIYMTKPVASEELLLAVRNLSRRVGTQQPASFEDSRPTRTWHLNILTRRLTSPEGRSIKLSGREVLLIEQIATKNGEAVARQALSVSLGYGTPSPENRALDAVLRRLREKFSGAGLHPPIVSVNNFGIRFAANLTLE